HTDLHNWGFSQQSPYVPTTTIFCRPLPRKERFAAIISPSRVVVFKGGTLASGGESTRCSLVVDGRGAGRYVDGGRHGRYLVWSVRQVRTGGGRMSSLQTHRGGISSPSFIFPFTFARIRPRTRYIYRVRTGKREQGEILDRTSIPRKEEFLGRSFMDMNVGKKESRPRYESPAPRELRIEMLSVLSLQSCRARDTRYKRT
ncbi:hypothetical protein BDP67DRAFT_509011, partial [Colletotrichum lupini]